MALLWPPGTNQCKFSKFVSTGVAGRLAAIDGAGALQMEDLEARRKAEVIELEHVGAHGELHDENVKGREQAVELA